VGGTIIVHGRYPIVNTTQNLIVIGNCAIAISIARRARYSSKPSKIGMVQQFGLLLFIWDEV